MKSYGMILQKTFSPKTLLLLLLICLPRPSMGQPEMLRYYDSVLRHGCREINRLWMICAEDYSMDPQTGISRSLYTYYRAQELDQLHIMYNSAYNLGVCNNELGNYEKAAYWLQEALQLGMRSRLRVRFCARALNNLGDMYLYQGKYKEALDYMFRAARIVEEDTGKDSITLDVLTRIYNNIAITLLYNHESDRALVYLNKGEVLAKQIGLPERLAHILNTRANAYLQRGDLPRARVYADEAYQLAVTHKPSRVEYTALQTLAEIYIAEGAPQKAIPYMKSVLEGKYFLNPYYKSGILFAIGNCYYATGNYEQAFNWLNKTFALAKEANITEYQLRYHQLISVLHADQGAYNLAYQHQQMAYLLNDSMLNKQKKEAVSQLEIKYRTAEKDMELVRRQLVISEQRSYLKQKNILLYSISGGTLLISMLSFSFYRTSRQKQRIHLLKAVIDREEQERTRIGQDLHDGIGSRLAAINMYFAATLRRYGGFEGRNEIEKIMKMMIETSGEVRNTAHNLIPNILSHHSFPEAVNLYCEQFSGEHLNILVQIEEEITELKNERLTLILFRIIQELVQNIIRHARATEAMVEIVSHDKELHIIVEDNGTGFQPLSAGAGMGLENIRQRVVLLQGDIAIDSGPGIGTSIVMKFELHKLKTITL